MFDSPSDAGSKDAKAGRDPNPPHKALLYDERSDEELASEVEQYQAGYQSASMKKIAENTEAEG